MEFLPSSINVEDKAVPFLSKELVMSYDQQRRTTPNALPTGCAPVRTNVSWWCQIYRYSWVAQGLWEWIFRADLTSRKVGGMNPHCTVLMLGEKENCGTLSHLGIVQGTLRLSWGMRQMYIRMGGDAHCLQAKNGQLLLVRGLQGICHPWLSKQHIVSLINSISRWTDGNRYSWIAQVTHWCLEN